MKAPQLFKTLTVTALACVLAHVASAKPAVYVADFFTQDREVTPLTTKLTSEFEVALSASGKYDMLERRDFDKIRSEAKNEAAIAEIAGLPSELLSALKTRNAELVVFGQVLDDIDDGKVSVTISFVTFSGEKKLNLNTTIPRGRINDSDTRKAAMEELVKRVVTSSRKVVQMEMNGVLLQIVRCRASDRVVIVDVTVTNNEDDKRFIFFCDDTILYDNAGNKTRASTAKLANQIGSRVDLDLVSAVPVKGSLEFQGVSVNADTIARLDIRCYESSRNNSFTVSFRNLPIER